MIAVGHLFENGELDPSPLVTMCSLFLTALCFIYNLTLEMQSKMLYLQSIPGEDNLSISSGIVPRVWKMAHVKPLHKGGDMSYLHNYRPISKLPCLAKVLESLINDQLKVFLLQTFHLEPILVWF